ncbi:heme exporter protein CcmD [Rhabdochromatium marinum]|uniref:heme exporter protein CcmD n=1 Tax=Rhabdochromatium marinum TaxID=48729 RepID=UPI0019083B80|nr:heme exporter protein CcmD [Rhabdochromatium marinum]MBK1647339.1 heme exporter protein CcmD [Rhabdochromatium marinum]
MKEFLHQGGYAFFVWGAYGVTFGLLAAEVVALMVNQRTILARVGRWVRGPTQGSAKTASRGNE